MAKRYRIDITAAAAKAKKRIPREHRLRIDEAIDALAENPRPRGCAKIDENLFRIRVGEYRIIYTIIKGRLLVLIVKIGSRKDVYRKR